MISDLSHLNPTNKNLSILVSPKKIRLIAKVRLKSSNKYVRILFMIILRLKESEYSLLHTWSQHMFKVFKLIQNKESIYGRLSLKTYIF